MTFDFGWVLVYVLDANLKVVVNVRDNEEI